MRSKSSAVLGLTVTWAIGCMYFVAADHVRSPIGWDSVKYLESARNLLGGNGLSHSPHGLFPLESDLVPLALWPPGFPTAIALASLLSGSVELSGVWLPRLGWFIAAAILLRFFLDLGVRLPWLALPALLTSAGTLVVSSSVMSEGLFLALVSGSMVALVRAAQPGRRAWAWALLAGALAGSSHLVRNLGIALVLAGPVAVALWAVLPGVRGRERWPSLLLWWVVGAAPAEIVLRVRSLVVFGGFESYEMSPSTIGIVDNVRWLAYGLVRDVSSVHQLAMDVAWNGAILAVAGLVAILVVVTSGVYAVTRAIADRRLDRALGILLLGTLAAAVAAVVVAARSTYDWGEVIMPRHIGLVTFCAAVIVLCAVDFRRPLMRAIPPVALGGLLVLHLATLSLDLRVAPVRFDPAENGPEAVAIRNLDPRALIASNSGPILTWRSGRSVRQVLTYQDPSVILPGVIAAVPEGRPLYLVTSPPLSAVLQDDPHPGFRRIGEFGEVLIFVREAPVPAGDVP